MPSGSGFWIIRPLNAPFLILLAAFLAVLAVGTFAAGRRTSRACRVQNVCVFLARLLLVFCAIIVAALFAGVGLWFLIN